jgi:Spy/CpxP family protein refolding chaperone
MKKIFLLLVAASVFGFAHAQNPTFSKNEAAAAKSEKVDWDKKIKAELNLTDEQAARYDAINKEYNEKIKNLGQSAEMTAEGQKAAKMVLKKEREAKLMEIFTPEQAKLYKEIMEAKKKEGMKKPVEGVQ